MKNYEKMCEECAELRIVKGIWCCEECFGQHCDDLDDCPLGLTNEAVIEAQTLTAEQQAVDKKMRSADTHVVKEKVKRERKPNEDKRILIQTIVNALSADCDAPMEVTNIEREINFTYGGKKYKIVLSCPRK